MGTSKDVERKIIWELTDLLRKNADAILSGDTKLCLTTSSLSILAANFLRVNQLSAEERNVQTAPRRHNLLNRSVADQELWKDNVKTLHDFLVKTVALKIIHVSYTIKAPVQIGLFCSLQVLELKKVPVHMIEGLSKLRGQLRELIISRSLQCLQDVLEICGGDRSSGLMWQNLKSGYFSFNYFQGLDNSLRFAPFLEVLDMSHNSIVSTEDYLQNLTDIVRINLGYNMLNAVPQFSYSNKGKLRTLVLRNNNLDNLEGLQELTALEELDLTDNCLADHGCLVTVSQLSRLSVLCLLGNPLSYKTNHRNITLGYVSAGARTGIFLLDGKRLTAHEAAISQEVIHKRATDVADSSAINNSGDESTLDQTDGELTDGQNTSLVVPGSQHARKKKRGHKRVHSKERIPKITNIDDMQDHSSVPKDTSPVGSYVEDVDDLAAIEREKQHVEILREHFKDDWLKALYADKQAHGSVEQTVTQSTAESGGTGMVVQAEITTGGASVREDDDTHQATVNENDRILMSDDRATKHPPTATVVDDTTTDFYSSGSPVPSDTKLTGKSTTDSGGSHNIQEAEWTRSNSEQEQHYGEESDPFIVMLPSDDMKQIIITVNDRYILEKDLKGTCCEKMDLKCLLSIKHSEEMLEGKDIVWGVMFPVVTLKFDYVRKDMKLRRYAMEDDTFARQLGDLLERHVTAARNQHLSSQLRMECLKCKHQFVKARQDHSVQVHCPQCSSKMVFDLAVQQPVTDSERLTDTGQKRVEAEIMQMASRKSPKLSPMLLRKSAVRRKDKETEEKLEVTSKADSLNSEVTTRSHGLGEGSVLRSEKGRRMSEGFIVGASLRETVDSLIPELGRAQELDDVDGQRNTTAFGQVIHITDDETVDHELPASNGDSTTVLLRESNILRTASTDQLRQTGRISGMVQHRSWSDMQKSVNQSGEMVQHRSWSDMQKLTAASAMHSSISSVESDITVLTTNSSRVSVGAISEPSRDCLVDSGKGHARSLPDNSVADSQNGSVARNNMTGDVMEGVAGNDRGRDSRGKTTPSGSPLSSSICSSMVSSVYENTLADAGDNVCDADSSHDIGNASSSDDSVTFRNKRLDPNSKSDSNRTGSVRKSDLASHLNGHTDISMNSELSVYKSAECSLAKTADIDTDTTVSPSGSADASRSSIYDTVDSRHFQDSTTNSKILSEELVSKNALSIYDVTDPDLSNKSDEEHSTNDDSSTDASLMRRGKRSRQSRKNRNFQFNGSGGDVEEYSNVSSNLETQVSDQNSATINIESAHSSFPPDLSPIKRVSNNRSSQGHRSAVIIDSEVLISNEDNIDVSHTSVLSSDRNEMEDSEESIANVSHSTADMRLPWESEESVSKEGSLSHEEFVNIDHRLQLYLELKVFHATETCQCAIRCTIVQYMKSEPVDSFLVISTTRILIYSIHGNPDSNNSSDWLKCYEDQPITELQFIDIGLGYQSLRLEFDTECSSYTLVIADEGQCKRILTLLTEILQSVSLSGHSRLEGISKSVPGTMVNLEAEVLQAGDQEPPEFVKYLMATLEDAEGDSDMLLGLVVTSSDVVLVQENHQWPLPRLQAPLGDLKGKQFTVKQREGINNIETLEFNEFNPCELRVSFFDEGSDDKLVWLLTMESTQGVKSFVEAIRAPWEGEFGVSLDITPVSLSD